ncbi:MAG: lysine--tRNA ligase [Microgenomates group bacterium]|nr:lysine--tRNA ligase [Microgenomates group bacterium]
MIWVDREIKKIKELRQSGKRKNQPEWVDDMKTPSGRIHVGALRGVVIHDLVYKVLLENGIKSNFTYVFDDHDPMDAIPSYLNYSHWEKYAGQQLYRIPAPRSGFKNFAEFYAQEFIEVFNSINCRPKIIWSSQLYNQGKMNSVIKEVLDAAPKIREIYYRVSKATKPENWYPFNVVCEKCQKIGTTMVYKWDGKYVYYRCLPQMVSWAQGCGHQGKVSPFNGTGKIPWKVEWAAKWKVIGVTIEGAGKDHMSAGGSHDIAKSICEQILRYPTPYPLPYEWFTVGGKKMSSSKGVGSSAKEVAQILPANVFRFLIVRTPINTALDFNPYGETILNLFDDYDRCLNAYFDKQAKKIPKGKTGEVILDFARIIELSQVTPLPKKRLFLPRFRTIVNLIKNRMDVLTFFNDQKKSLLTKEEKEILEERIIFAKIYLKTYYQEELSEKTKKIKTFSLTNKQKQFINDLTKALLTIKKEDKELIQSTIFSVLKKGKYQAREVFPAFYQLTIGQPFGPKAADLIIQEGIKEIIKKLDRQKT